MRVVKCRLRAKGRAESHAAVEARQPAAEPYGPEREVAERQGPIAGALDLAGFLLDVPDKHVKEHLERRAVTVLQAPRTSGYAAYPPRREPKKTHQAVRLAQGKCLQNDGFRFPRRHGQSARRRCAGPLAALRQKRAHTQSYCNYHTRTQRAMFP